MEELNTKLGEQAEAAAEKIAAGGEEIDRLGKVIDDYAADAPAADLETILAPAVDLHKRLLADKDALIDPYLTGLCNGALMARAAIEGRDLSEDEMATPATNSPIKGAKSLTMREHLIKKAGKYVTLQQGVFRLRTNLSEDDMVECEDTMRRLKVPEGEYFIPEK